MNWYVKSAGQLVLSKLPFGVQINDFLSNLVGEQRHLDRHVERRLPVILRLINIARDHHELGGTQVVEMGTGWAPLFPVLAGVCSAWCTTFDVTRYLKPERLRKVLVTLRGHSATIADSLGIAEDSVRGRFDKSLSEDRPSTVDAMLEPFSVTYRAPVDSTSLPLDAGAVDVYFSNLVLTHIPIDILKRVLAESNRVLADNGIALHRMKFRNVELLKYSTAFFDRFVNSTINYNNRLQAPQFKELFDAAGFELIDSREQIDDQQLARLARIQVAEEFRGMSGDELATAVLIGVWKKD